MGLRKQFRDYNVIEANNNTYERALCDIEKSLRFDFEFLDEFLSGGLTPIFYYDIAYEIFGLRANSPEAEEFGRFFDTTLNEIILAHLDVLASQPSYKYDYEDPDQFGRTVWKNILHELKQVADDLAIAGTSVKQPRIKKEDLRLLVP